MIFTELKCYKDNNKETRDLFLKLPKRLYKSDSPQDIKTEKQILSNSHALSKDFQIYPFVVARDNVPVCRCILTVYENDENGYAGFFEAENDINAVRFMFKMVCQKAAELKKSSLVGPLDSSIFIKYRFKLDHFDSTYTGEPINLPYYPHLWEECGFKKSDSYVSNQLRKVSDSDIDTRYQKVYERYIKKGCRFISPTDDTFPEILKDVYGLLMDLYAEFPGYKRIDEREFTALFGNLRSALNYQMVRMVYKDDKLAAFCICIPNYKNLTLGKITPLKLMRILKIKKKPSEYVITYVGASKSAPGLGCALIHDIRNILYQNQCTSIGALIHTGKLTEKMYENLYIDQRHYALYKKETAL